MPDTIGGAGTRRPVSRHPRTGTPPHQHAILLHELAELIRASGDLGDFNKRQAIELVRSMREWVGTNAPGLLADSLALNTLVEARRAATPDGTSTEAE